MSITEERIEKGRWENSILQNAEHIQIKRRDQTLTAKDFVWAIKAPNVPTVNHRQRHINDWPPGSFWLASPLHFYFAYPNEFAVSPFL